MNLFVDCTPINIGRNIYLLKKISKESGVHIVCSTSFYYTDETVLYNMSEEKLAECIVTDAKETNAGIIKAAAENEKLSTFNEKMLKATALFRMMNCFSMDLNPTLKLKRQQGLTMYSSTFYRGLKKNLQMKL